MTIFSGDNPLTLDPLTLFLFQAIIIILVCRLLSLLLVRLRQPAVIAEVIGGIVLGPSVLGNIPKFSTTVFPQSSLTVISVISQVGLVLYLYKIGLELDINKIRTSAKRSLLISIAGIALPFVLGVACAFGIRNILNTSTKVPMASLAVFFGICMSITAFSVLSRILAELGMLNTTVGNITIAAAALDDVLAWCLLAIVLSMIGTSANVEILYIFLCVLAWALICFLVIRPMLSRLLASQRHELTPLSLVVVLLLPLLSAFYTQCIGVHALFGAALAGIIVPHTKGFARHLRERVNTIVVVVLLPLYYASSGLKTQLGLLNTGEAWGCLVLVVVCAISGKVIGAGLMARFVGCTTREALTIGALMNSKGLVELIVLNIGLDAGVIDARVFTIMVVMALLMAFMTTPVVAWIYPPRYYVYVGDNQESDSADEEAAEHGQVRLTSMAADAQRDDGRQSNHSSWSETATSHTVTPNDSMKRLNEEATSAPRRSRPVTPNDSMKRLNEEPNSGPAGPAPAGRGTSLKSV